MQINIAALRIAADKFDPEFIERRRVALEVQVQSVYIIYCTQLHNVQNNLLKDCW